MSSWCSLKLAWLCGIPCYERKKTNDLIYDIFSIFCWTCSSFFQRHSPYNTRYHSVRRPSVCGQQSESWDQTKSAPSRLKLKFERSFHVSCSAINFTLRCWFLSYFGGKMFVEKPKEEVYDVIINKVSLLGCFCF